MMLDQLPEEVLEIMLYLLETQYKLQPRLAGGAVRDTMLDKPIKDWDFFLYPPSDKRHVNGVAEYISRNFNWLIDRSISVDRYSSTFDNHSFVSLKHGDTGRKIELIFNTMKIEDFDHAICQCEFDLVSREYRFTKDFERARSKEEHCIYMRNLHTYKQMIKCFMSHTPRILEKYPWSVRLEYDGVAKEYSERLMAHWFATMEEYEKVVRSLGAKTTEPVEI